MNANRPSQDCPPASREILRGGMMVMLLIEDNPGDVMLIEEMLSEATRNRFALVKAARLSQGLESLTNQAIDLVLLDLSLPDSHGLDTLRKTRQAAPNVPVVVLTGSNDMELGAQAVNEGAQDYLAKDWVNSRILERTIIHAIGRRQVEDQRIALAVEQERVRILASFVNDVSHEIRTPLAVIQLAAESLEKFSDLDVRGFQRTQQIREQAFFINTLVDSMLVLTELDSGTVPVFSRIRINRIVQSVNLALRTKAEEKRQTLWFELAERLPPINANPDQMYIALLNLIDNAIHFTPEGGAIVVKTELSDPAIRITIRDSGIGIAPEDIPRIFERFFRADRARTGRHTGLGLAITQKIVELHNGAIEVQSRLGQGSNFQVSLPISTETSPL